MKSIWKASALVAVVMLAAACGDDDSSGGDLSAEERGVTDPARQELVEAMVNEGAVGQEAVCFIDELGLDDAERIYGADEADLSEDDLDRAMAAFEKCSEGESAPDDTGSDDSGAGDDDGGASDGGETAAGDLSDMRSCLEDGGLTVGDSSAPDELNESLGIVDTLTVLSDSGGAGVVTLYDDTDLASEAREFESDAEGGVDGVTIGQMNELVYSYSGDSGGLASLEGCL